MGYYATSKKGWKSKAESEFKHAQRRARERYDIDLHQDRYTQLCKQIESGQGEFLGKQSLRLSVWRIQTVDSNGDKVSPVVIYDKSRHQIVTFLPPGITNAKGVELGEPGLNDEGAENG
jgi:hypothetical protein